MLLGLGVRQERVSYLFRRESDQPIRERYFGHLTGNQPITDQYVLIWSVHTRLRKRKQERVKEREYARVLFLSTAPIGGSIVVGDTCLYPVPPTLLHTQRSHFVKIGRFSLCAVLSIYP